MEIIQSSAYSEDNIDRVLNFAKEQGGVEYAYKKIKEFQDEAEGIISYLSVDKQFKDLLHLLLIYFNERKH